MSFDVNNLGDILIDYLNKNNKLINNNNNFNEEYEDLILNNTNNSTLNPKYDDIFLTDKNIKYIKNTIGSSGFLYSDNLYIFYLYHSKNNKIYVIWYSKEDENKGCYLLE